MAVDFALFSPSFVPKWTEVSSYFPPNSLLQFESRLNESPLFELYDVDYDRRDYQSRGRRGGREGRHGNRHDDRDRDDPDYRRVFENPPQIIRGRQGCCRGGGPRGFGSRI